MSAEENTDLFGGDILLSTEEKRLLHWKEADKNSVPGTKTADRGARAVVKLRRKKWVRGIVPYELSSDFSECLLFIYFNVPGSVFPGTQYSVF